MAVYKTYCLLGLFVAGFLKTFLKTPTFVDAAVLLVVGSVFAYFEYKNSEKRVKELENLVLQKEKTLLETLEKNATEIHGLRERVTAMEFSQKLRNPFQSTGKQ